MFLDTLIFGILLPVLISAVVALLAHRPWRGRPEGDPLPSWGAPLAIGLAFAAGHFGVTGRSWPDFPPADATHWLLFGALLAGAIGTTLALLRAPRWLGWGLFAILGGVAIVLFTSQMRAFAWERAEAAAWLAAAGLAWMVALTSEEALAARERQGSGTAVALIALSAGTAAPCGFLAGSLMLAQLALVLCVTLLPFVALSWWRGGFSLDRGGLATALLLLLGILLAQVLFADLPGPVGLAVLLAPLAGWAGTIRREGLLRKVLPFALAAVVLGSSVAVWQACSSCGEPAAEEDAPTNSYEGL